MWVKLIRTVVLVPLFFFSDNKYTIIIIKYPEEVKFFNKDLQNNIS